MVLLGLNNICIVEIYSDIQWFHMVLFNEGLSSFASCCCNEAIEMHVCNLSMGLEKLKFNKIIISMSMVSVSVELWMHLGSCCALKERQSHLHNSSFMLSNLLHASLTWKMYTEQGTHC